MTEENNSGPKKTNKYPEITEDKLREILDDLLIKDQKETFRMITGRRGIIDYEIALRVEIASTYKKLSKEDEETIKKIVEKSCADLEEGMYEITDLGWKYLGDGKR